MPPDETAVVPPRSRAIRAGYRLWSMDLSGKSWVSPEGQRVLTLPEVLAELDAAEEKQDDG